MRRAHAYRDAGGRRRTAPSTGRPAGSRRATPARRPRPVPGSAAGTPPRALRRKSGGADRTRSSSASPGRFDGPCLVSPRARLVARAHRVALEVLIAHERRDVGAQCGDARAMVPDVRLLAGLAASGDRTQLARLVQPLEDGVNRGEVARVL